MSNQQAAGTLAEVTAIRPDQAVQLLADLSATLAACHEAGRSHGSIDPRHVRPGSTAGPAHLLDWPEDAGAERIDDDVRQFGLLVEFVAGRIGPSGRSRGAADRVRMQLDALAATTVDPDPSRRPSMEQFATALDALRRRATTAPGAAPRQRSPRTLGIAAAAVAVAALGATGVLVAGRGASEPPTPPDVLAPTPTAVAPTASEPVGTGSPGRIERSGRDYEAGAAGDLLVNLDAACPGGPVAVLLADDDGAVITFDRWPDGPQGVEGQVVGTVPGAIGATADDGCRSLAVHRDVGLPVEVSLGRPS